jgi:Undecaprenyl-phosphate glucose phosphotransferase
MRTEIDLGGPSERTDAEQAPRENAIRRRTRLEPAWSGDLYVALLVATDFFSVMLAGILAHYSWFTAHAGNDFRAHLAASAIAALAVLQTNSQFGLYRPPSPRLSRLRLVERIFSSLIVAGLILLLLAELANVDVTLVSFWKVGLLAYSLTFICLARVGVDFTFAQLGRSRLLSRNVVIVGAGQNGETLLRCLLAQNCPWTRVLCIFDDRARDPKGRLPRRLYGYPVLGTTQDLVAFSRRFRVDEILIALPWQASDRIRDVLNAVRVVPANIHLCPELRPAGTPRHKLSALDGLPVVTMADKPVSGWSYVIKRSLDAALALVGLLLVSPLLLAVIVWIKLDSPGPVLFKQKRLGFNNRLFDVYKFRTMYHDQSDASASRLATRDDPRITRAGRFLRRTSIDELPQLLNVLLGDMSLVGPRPHAVKAKAGGLLYPDVVAEYALRHRIKPGITGWAQVNGWRGETDTAEKIVKRVEHDLYYIDNWSVLFDLYIILLTVLKVPFHRNAY